MDLRNFEHQSSLRPAGAPNPRLPWAALDQEGLSRDVLMLLDPHLIAHSLILFHRAVLDQTPENITAGFVLGAENLAPQLPATHTHEDQSTEEREGWGEAVAS
ncbi:hypothetical protein C0991_000648, partial [Blastosporella zonata]